MMLLEARIVFVVVVVVSLVVVGEAEGGCPRPEGCSGQTSESQRVDPRRPEMIDFYCCEVT